MYPYWHTTYRAAATQISHAELTREISRRFNRTHGEVFPVPKDLVSQVSRLVGIDGRIKMRESLNNFIYLGDKSKTITEKVTRVYTDPTSIYSIHPSHMEGNPVFIYIHAFNPDTDKVKNLKDIYQADRMGDVEMKGRLVGALNSFLDPIRKKRAYYQCHTDELEETLLNSTQRAKWLAEQTMSEARVAIGIDSYLN